MRQAIQQFIDYLTIQKGYSPRTIKAYEYDLEKFSEFLVKNGRPSEIKLLNKHEIFSYLAYLSHHIPDKKTISVVSRARKLASIRSFFNFLMEYELIEKNPAQHIDLPQLPQTEPEYLTVEEYQQLLVTVAKTATPFFKERDLALLVLLLSTGIRVSELVGLHLEAVDLEAKSIKVTRKRNKEQTIPLSEVAVLYLQNYLQARPVSEDSSVFLSKLKTGMRQNTIFSLTKKYLSRAGLKKSKQGPHLLRHSCFTTLLSRDVNPVVIQSLAGHSSFDTTRRYLHINNKQLREATEKIEIDF